MHKHPSLKFYKKKAFLNKIVLHLRDKKSGHVKEKDAWFVFLCLTANQAFKIISCKAMIYVPFGLVVWSLTAKLVLNPF